MRNETALKFTDIHTPSPEEIRLRVAEGRRLRARFFNDMVRTACGSIASAFRNVTNRTADNNVGG